MAVFVVQVFAAPLTHVNAAISHCAIGVADGDRAEAHATQ